MKNKSSVIDIQDFSAGLLTTPNQIADKPEEAKFTPDCLNVYAEGPSLRKRFGISKINTVSAGTTANGLYNWVLNASQQYLMGLFDTTLKQMSVSGTTWSGTWVTVSPDSANGTNFTNGIMHFVTYQGTLIMTNENRDKPQRMTVTDTSYKNIDFSGTGTAPFAKYPQIWKEHVFLLNVGAGGQLSEDCNVLTNWTNQDIGTGATTQTSFGGVATFRYRAGTNSGDNSQIKRVISGMTTAYSAEIKTYFNTLGAVTSGDYAWLDIYNGTIRFRTRWSTDGVETFNGTTWLKVGVNLVTTGTWIVWKYLVTAGTATAAVVDVFKNGSAVGLQFSVANATTASNGQIQLTGNAGGSANRCDWYMDYLYILSITSRTNYYTDGVFNSWVSSSQASYTDNVLPSTPYTQYKLNDNAATSVILDTGSTPNNAAVFADATTINTSAVTSAGKIGSSVSLTSASSHNIQLSATTLSAISADTGGSIAVWIKPNSSTGIICALGVTTANSYLAISCGTQPNANCIVAGVDKWACNITNPITDSAWNHVVLTHNGTTPSLYINGSLGTTVFTTSTDKTLWVAGLGTLNNGRIGCRNKNSEGNSLFYNGLIDDFRYYRTALSSADVAALYAEGNGTEGQPLTVREGTTIYTGTFSYRVNNDGQYALVSQTLSAGTAIAGVASVLGLFINATNNSTYKLRINDGTTTYDSSVLTGNGTWQYQTLTFTPASNSTSVLAQVISLSSSTVYIDMVGIVVSTTGATQDFSDRLQRSQSGTYDTWTGGDSGTNDITTPGDVGLTGSFILQDRMYVTKAWNIYRITYTGSVPLLDIKQARSVVGTKSPRATKNIDFANYGEIVIFFGTDRNLYLFDGFSSTPLTDGIQLNNNITQVYTNNINTQALDKIFAVNHSDLGWYEIFVPIGNSSVPNYSIVYNYRTKAIWPFDNRNFSCGNISDDGSGQRVIMVNGATNGLTYQLNVGNSDDGTAINGYWTSFKLGASYLLNKMDEIDLATDSVAATPSFSWRANYETTYITKVLKTNTNKHNFDPSRIDNLIQFKITDNSTNPTFKLWQIKGLERSVGGGT